jgi:arabinose-5-phosphate isomerase
MDKEAMLTRGRDCLALEAQAIQLTRSRLGDAFVQTLERIRVCHENGGKLIFSGVGKNEPVCEKIRATFNSTGVTAVYLDPLKALHGDLGLCNPGDLAFLFSNSGNSEELIALNGFLKRIEVQTIAFTSRAESPLAQASDQVLTYQYEKEACPLELAPTASTTASLALGDALAMVFLEMRGFSREDFARYHPSGSLGKSLLLRVKEVMRTKERVAILPENCLIRDAVVAITRARCGIIALSDDKDGTLKGVFSDGDFRRAAIRETDVMNVPVSRYMTANPITVRADALAVEALRIFQKHRINDLIVVDAQNRPVGLLDGQDLPNLKLI